MNLIFHCEFGSVVYGTSVPTSDKDYKGIYLPEPNELILQRVKPVIVQNTKSDERAKNTKDDIDSEAFSYQQFLRLLTEGQTPILDMLFVPEKHILKTSHFFEVIKENRHKLINRRVASFVGYCQTQAAKYGIKGSRIAAVRKSLELISIFPETHRLLTHKYVLDELVNANSNDKLIQYVQCKAPNGLTETHLEVCNRKFPLHATVKYVKQILTKIFDEYGHRAKLAETNDGVDWKALYHAVRVAGEAKELLLTGEILFPRYNADLLLKIRKGELPYKEVAELIEQGLDEIKEIEPKSILPLESDKELADRLVLEAYRSIL